MKSAKQTLLLTVLSLLFGIGILFLLQGEPRSRAGKADSVTENPPPEPSEKVPSIQEEPLPPAVEQKEPARTEADSTQSYELAGRVQSPAGDPIPDAEVEVRFSRDKTGSAPRLAQRLRSDPSGRFLVLSLPKRTYRVEAHKEGFSREVLYGISLPLKEELEIVLHAPATISGTVRDRATGKGIPEAQVSFDYLLLDSSIQHGPEASTNAQGAFQMPGVRAGQPVVVLGVAKEGYARQTVRLADLNEGESRSLEIQLTPGFRLSGRTVDDLGRPLSEVQLSLKDEGVNLIVSSSRSDAKGLFSFPEVSGDSIFSLVASKAGFSTVIREALRLPISELELALERLGAIAGTVHSAEGLPPGRFTVKAFQEATEGYRSEETSQEFHTLDGAFHLQNIPPGEVTLVVHAEGFAPARTEALRLAPGDKVENLRIQMRRGASAHGTAIGENGRPLAGVRAALGDRARTGTLLGTIGPGALSDAQGRFTLGGIPEGPGAVRLSRDGLAESTVFFLCEGEEPVDLGTVVLARGGSVEGVCLGPYGQPLEGFIVEALTPTRLQPITVRAGPGGRYRMDVLPAGPMTLSGHYPNRLPGVSPLHRFHRTLEIRNGGTEEVNFDYRIGGKIRGRVLGLGPNAPGDLVVNLLNFEGETVEGSTLVDSRGGFEIDAVRAGEYELWVRSPSRDYSSSLRVRLAEGEVAEVEFQVGEQILSGFVTDSSGRPLGGVLLTARRIEEDALGYRATTDETGIFTLEGVEAGTYRLDLSKPGYASSVLSPLEVRVQEDRKVQIRMSPASSLRLLAKSADGKPVPRAVLRIEKKDDPLFPANGEYEGNDQGLVIFPDLGEGEYTAGPVAEEIFPSVLEVRLGPGAKAAGEIVLRRRGSLRVLLRYASSQALKDIQVNAVLKEAEIGGDAFNWSKAGKVGIDPAGGFTGPDGKILFTGLPEGRYEVVVLGGVQSQSVSVPPGKTVEVVFDL